MLKDQAKEYYSRYKELKHTFVKERKVLHEKNANLNADIQINIEENEKLSGINDELHNELNYMKKKLGIKDKDITKGT